MEEWLTRNEEAKRNAEQAKQDRLRRIRATDPAKMICVDVETTGLSSIEDEILQLSIIDGNSKVLFNEYIRPKGIAEWPEAEAINHISPTMVEDKTTIDAYLPQLNDIFSAAELIVGYNIDAFDLFFIKEAGIHVPEDTMTYDVMLEFAPVYGEWNDYFQEYRWQKLAVCADYYGYQSHGSFHDSLEDVRATLHCFYTMTRDN